MELWVASNIMTLNSFLYIAASRTTHAHVHYFSCVYTLLVVIQVLLSSACYFFFFFFSLRKYWRIL